MNIQPHTFFDPSASVYTIWKPFVFRNPKYQWNQKSISDRNIQLLSSHIGKRVIISNQTHSADITLLEDTNRGTTLDWDAIITQLRDVLICVMASDCVPVILYDNITQSIWVIHAGRKWLEWGIISRCITSMSTIFSAQIHDFQAYIWACISQDKYELGKQEVEFFQKIYPHTIKKSLKNNNKYFLDIWAVAYAQLEESGIKKENIILSSECTYSESEKYHSYRRNTHTPDSGSGNNIFGICLN